MTDRDRQPRQPVPLMQRLARSQTAAPDPAAEDAAIRAMEQWPLLGLLTQELRGAPRPVSLRSIQPIDPPDAGPRQTTPVDQMFVRLERMTKPVPANMAAPPSTLVVQPVASMPMPQPLPQPPAQPQPMPSRPATETPVTIEPREVLHHDAAVSPARLFERMKG